MAGLMEWGLLKLLTTLWRESSTPDYPYLREGNMRRTGFSASTGLAKEKDICGAWYVLEIQLAVLRLTDSLLRRRCRSACRARPYK